MGRKKEAALLSVTEEAGQGREGKGGMEESLFHKKKKKEGGEKTFQNKLVADRKKTCRQGKGKKSSAAWRKKGKKKGVGG